MQELLLLVRDKLAEPSAAPRYMQLAALLKAEIKRRKELSGQFLPAERTIAQQTGLSRVTVSRSLALLEESGLIVRQQGIGTRVSQHLSYSLDEDESGFTSLVLQSGGVAGNLWLERSRIKLSASIAEEMSLPEGEWVTHLRRVRLINGEPASLEAVWIPLALLPEPRQLEHSLYQYWAERHIYPDKKRYRLKAVASPADVADYLNVPLGSPLLLSRQHTYDAQGALLEYCEIYCRSDVYEFQVTD
ncbi:GntR family transcriptional regulator [Brenneria goodwinii]|uniref:GntR family transcriptional regulator n=1 Tax=Brenneria goodwinii TaxID=1109412 RepID=UPI000EF1E021|nr:GntR family transcriptional regulator [Brenneria goodwinii]MCG8156150.1 GntR family transcriptional regulator [Brenneria goodwinii]MCG8160795.1 GntR family transcriptional regulator [Brenneria goodwinii]MCG8165875.1 GntR family transcriptional regulator [Brenneria goodwinii]MCG8170363.1 GntR family transcriptional regulator [Brenneria goodwinii]MCG8175231.1 GntR family transcriptional regulator [Brenneria goodwinii]